MPKFDIKINGSMPESVRADGGCQLNLYLLQVKENGHLKNAPVRVQTTPVIETRAMTIPYQPLALDLYYLLTAFAGKDYRQEQRAMSIAVRCLYERPILRVTVPFNGSSLGEEFTLQMEIESADELGRVWQAFSAPFRLSAVYRVSVVFMTPEAPDTEPAPPPEHVVVFPDPVVAPFGDAPQVLGTSATVEGFAPTSTVATPLLRRYELSPAVVMRGDSFLLHGEGLGGTGSDHVYLLPASGPEQDITAWLDPDPAKATISRLELAVPGGAGSPAAGVYQVRVGNGTVRSNSTPLSVAARVGPATNPPLLAPAGGVYTIGGSGFVAATTELSLGAVPLTRVTSAPSAGEFRVVSQSSITFAAPTGLDAGQHEVRVRVNDIETPAQWWVDLP